MEEKIIIESKSDKMKKVIVAMIAFGLLLAIVGLILYFSNYNHCREYGSYYGYTYHGNISIIDNMLDPFSFLPGLLIDIGLLFAICFALVSWRISSYKLTVTNKRIYGKTSFGRRVDLPLDSVSAVGLGAFKSIAVATSSGKIKFAFIENCDSIHAAISDLLVKRQTQQPTPAPVAQPAAQSAADELKKYKELLDSGVITQEEFDAKKKQLLDL